MKIETFQSGEYKQRIQYKSFTPTLVNREWSWDDPRINVLLEDATRALAELNAFTLIVPDVDLFVRMHIYKEASVSSKIEGTRTEFDEAIMDESDILPERRDDWHEVNNYTRAMNYAIEELSRLPLSMRLLRQTHEILMQGARGEKKTPGEFRRSQNWIGGTSLSDAAFIPPHEEELPELLSDLEKFWHNETIKVPHLIRCAISHYQFETIHPFLDGNGRIGRLLITLYLVSHGLLTKPSLYLSDHLHRHRAQYYDALSRVRETHDLGHWIRFFLQAVTATGESGKSTFLRILALRREMEMMTVSLGRRAEIAQRLLRHLYVNPIITVKEAEEVLGVAYNPANSLIKIMVDKDVLREATGFQRNRAYLFWRYIEIFKDPK